MAAKAKKSEVTDSIENAIESKGEVKIQDSKPERILLSEDKINKDRLEKAFYEYLPYLQRVVDLYNQLDYPIAITLEFVYSLVIPGGESAWPAFETEYRSYLYDTTPAINSLPLIKEAILPGIKVPAALYELKQALDEFREFSKAPKYEGNLVGYDHPIHFVHDIYQIVDGKASLHPEKYTEYIERNTANYITDPFQIAVYHKLHEFVKKANELHEVLGNSLFGNNLLGMLYQTGNWPYHMSEIYLDLRHIKSLDVNPALKAKFMGVEYVAPVPVELEQLPSFETQEEAEAYLKSKGML
ncbi:hypothetical protein QNI16_15360 [Cytophagaceae bacterium YF14B1]|uniref:Uncharacterized protein n=1 Tax=Xanthocytophaga flava TaxID=3048013 RepID=A0AAE3U953_9BACT|nr:hypothetical protein [Xanthocytophaga flavus]MDJ1481878.1 hypothetical protein [Xanthocytophaga flavus]